MARRSGSFQHRLLQFIALTLGILLAVMLSLTLYVQHMLDGIHYTQSSTVLPSVEQISNLLPDLGADTADPDRIGGKGSGLVNILLIGQDRREGDSSARSDTMILCTLHKETAQVTLTSFLRDLYVTIPGHGDNRINAAYAFGGGELLADTLKENFAVHVDGIVEVDFTQFSRIIDMAGGVTMELRQDEADAINAATGSNLTAGEQWLTGSQALVYSRIRNLDSDGDFSRTNRQRKVISALVRAYRNADLSQVLSMVTQALPMICTDMSKLTLLRYAAEFFPALAGSLSSQQVPGEGAYSNQVIDDMAVLVADKEEITGFLRQTLLGSSWE